MNQRQDIDDWRLALNGYVVEEILSAQPFSIYELFPVANYRAAGAFPWINSRCNLRCRADTERHILAAIRADHRRAQLSVRDVLRIFVQSRLTQLHRVHGHKFGIHYENLTMAIQGGLLSEIVNYADDPTRCENPAGFSWNWTPSPTRYRWQRPAQDIHVSRLDEMPPDSQCDYHGMELAAELVHAIRRVAASAIARQPEYSDF